MNPRQQSDALRETLDYLRSPAASRSLEADPYWPKWDSPWWRMTLLHEMGLAREIPGAIVGAMLESIGRTYLPFFPLEEKDLPPGKDPHRNVMCHCALGTMYQVLSACGVKVDREFPWARPWFLKYQLPDGGLNCDEAAYLKPTPHSSFLSTLPALEAVLGISDRSAEEESFLDRGAEYLIRRRLCRSVSKGMTLIDPEWLKPCFPRFYYYDVLRGRAFLVRWAGLRGRELPPEVEVTAGSRIERRAFEGAKTLRLEDGFWTRGLPAATFPLLDEVSEPGREVDQAPSAKQRMDRPAPRNPS